MKLFMVIETFKSGKKNAVYERYHQFGRMMPDGLQYINSWLEVDGERCFQIMQGENAELFDVWIKEWKDLVEFEVVEITESPTAKNG